jgi:predicted GNAT family acetyltransferase
VIPCSWGLPGAEFSAMTASICHNPALQRFEARLAPESGLAEHLAVCEYRQQGAVLVLHHTEVPPQLQGQGLAAELVAAALDWARAQGLRVRPSCSYVAQYMRRHPATLDLLETAEGLP